MAIPFIQFLLPHGEKREQSIARPPEIEEKARKLIEKGARFEIEVLTTNQISMEVMLGDKLLAGELCANGPQVPKAVDKMVDEAFKKLFKENH